MVDFRNLIFDQLQWASTTTTYWYILVLTATFKSFVLSTKNTSSIQRDKEIPLAQFQPFQRALIDEHSDRTSRRKRSLPSISSSAIKELVDFHNKERRKEKASNMIEMRWDNNLASNAQRWADQCTFHYPGHYVTSVVDQSMYLTPYPDEKHNPPNFTIAALAWSRERKNYKRKLGSCAPNSSCDNYLTMVKWNVIQIGCGVKVCLNLDKANEETLFFVCEYYPRFTRSTVKLYLAGEPCSECPNEFPNCNRGLCSGDKSMYPPWDMNAKLSILKNSNAKMRSQSLIIWSSVILMMMMRAFP